MADTFEYVDDQGKTHQVHSLQNVPHKYLKSMLVIGEEQAPAPAPRTAAPPRVDPRLGKWLDLASRINPNVAVPLVLLLVWLKYKQFLARVAVVLVAAFWGFHLFYGWFEGSRYWQPGEAIHKKEAPAKDP